MRTKMAVGLALLLGASGAGVAATSAPPPVDAASARLAASGFAALARGDLPAAIDQFETSLAVDPMNTQAYLGLARTAEKQGLTGKALRFYRESLAINPNDLAAIEGQGGAFAARGATARAQASLARLQTLCGTAPCPAAKRLEAAIAQAGRAPAALAAAETATPTPRP